MTKLSEQAQPLITITLIIIVIDCANNLSQQKVMQRRQTKCLLYLRFPSHLNSLYYSNRNVVFD
jgi:hypothetical protein